MLTLYHNPQCKKSRAALLWLKEQGHEFRIREYLKDGLSLDEFKRLLQKLNLTAVDMLRKQEPFYKEQLKGKQFHEAEWMHILLEQPRLIRRPIVEAKLKAVIADPIENLHQII